MTNDKQPKDASRELDILDFVGKFGNFVWLLGSKLSGVIGKFFALLVRGLHFCLRKTLWFALMFALMFALNKFANEQFTNNYQNIMTIKMNRLSNEEVMNFVNSIGAVGAGDNAWLYALNLPSDTIAKQIISVRACWGIDYNYDNIMDVIDIAGKYNLPREWDTLKRPSMVLKDRFYVVSTAAKKSAIPFIQKGIEEKIRANPYFATQITIKRNAAIASIREINYQIRLLDSLQKVEYFAKKDDSKSTKLLIQPQGQIVSFQEKEQRLMHKEALGLANERIVMEAQLALPEMEITAGATGIEQRSVVKVSFVFALLMALAAAIIWDYRKWLLEQVLSPFVKTDK